ncbi:hypothetical protein FisN_7Hh359 [Fistulifera solaris]|uniref:Phosphoribulokinase/uridine kinase domain-containing protein n=1 Tax=Fistulifera solaris TaxID=1519565 RepID=A0A1Z5KRY9_FISSO|nr:hypothetical protein FisN_7Hh359 [Fistulifera solaris]|eukprot:GAX29049.1 hypothetical protein FisN_7Hh359 [Fistulifera solaris]
MTTMTAETTSGAKTNNKTHEPLQQLAHELWQRAKDSQHYWVGIAGGPGSGKSTCAREVALVLNSLQPNCCLVIPMDGYHCSQDTLLEQFGEEGLRRKGAPFTFDTTALVQDLRHAQEAKQRMYFPDYSRETSRPVPDAIAFDPHTHRIILVEGLYLLHTRDPAWAPLQEMWDERWWVEVPSREEQIERVVQRAFRTWNSLKKELWGDGVEGARKRTLYNDVPNMETIAYCRECADVIIETGSKECRVYHRMDDNDKTLD